MSQQPKTIREAIKLAIIEEMNAYDLYKKTSEKVKSKGTKNMLSELAEQEKAHQAFLEQIVDEDDAGLLGEGIPEESLGIANFLVASNLKENATPKDVLVFAIKEEEKALKFYTDLKNFYAGTELEKLFNRLAAEERGHKIQLEKEYEDNVLQEN